MHCDCHAPAVFGHQPDCSDGLGPRALSVYRHSELMRRMQSMDRLRQIQADDIRRNELRRDVAIGPGDYCRPARS